MNVNKKNDNYWVDGILGVVTGDALGVPVEFCSRRDRDIDPVQGMRGYGTFNLPAGSWSDDSSMTLAALDSLGSGKLNLDDVMKRFERWLFEGNYTPWGRTFDVGGSCMRSIENYSNGMDVHNCGTRGEYDNGNGSLMRIMPFVLYMYREQREHGMTDEQAMKIIHEASALTHAHRRSCIACGLYYCMAREILDARAENSAETLQELLQKGLDAGFRFYKEHSERSEYAQELGHYDSLRNLESFKAIPSHDVRGSGYVVDAIEAAVYSLINTVSYEECELMAVNFGEDTDTTAAIAGGLAGLFYTAHRIPTEWLDVIARKEWIVGLCEKAANATDVDTE